MNMRAAWPAFVAVLALAVVTTAVVGAGVVDVPWTTTGERATVTLVGADGTALATVDAAVADTAVERYVGLSDHDSLAPGRGMLFVHGAAAERTYVMRGMEFGIDLVFVGADRRITAIHTAPAPPPGVDGETLTYSGRAKWVLEVPAGFVDRHGLTVGDRIRIDYGR